MTGISHRTCKAIYAKLRVHITKFCIDERADSGAFELDESFFGSHIRGKRRRSAAVKTPVFSLFKRNGRVRVSIVQNCLKDQIISSIQGKILEGRRYILMDGRPMMD